ncbi:hypothetical protein B0H63DRAFT_57648 [Podospora didyma]|uniref:Uncharacterized protein n=1 Tax=Podospora didyma TaxID=330526 RepID=A0AAE0P7L8_9PEZI|nr:hypothetical protein B0H63DRAFT_57648 [Podospora didyma]
MFSSQTLLFLTPSYLHFLSRGRNVKITHEANDRFVGVSCACFLHKVCDKRGRCCPQSISLRVGQPEEPMAATKAGCVGPYLTHPIVCLAQLQQSLQDPPLRTHLTVT